MMMQVRCIKCIIYIGRMSSNVDMNTRRGCSSCCETDSTIDLSYKCKLILISNIVQQILHLNQKEKCWGLHEPFVVLEVVFVLSIY